jgi:protein RecA
VAKKERDTSAVSSVVTDDDDIAKQLVRDLNKEFGMQIAYNLSCSEAPTLVKRWISTGSIQLDYAIANKPGGGYPEGRIIEITGLPSTGKSHLAYHAASVVQKMGGLVVYIDTENATPVDKLARMGIDIAKKFVYCDTHCTEEVFKIIESTITRAKQIVGKNIPILVIYDSVASSSPKAELDGDYDEQTVGLQARTLSKCMRKIVGTIGQNNVTLLILNQLREKIGVMHGDPLVAPGGKAIPFHASVRVRLGSGSPVKDKAGNIIGIHVTVSIKKNKVAAPFRHCEFDILFGKGISEHEYLFDELRAYCDSTGPVVADGSKIMIEGTGPWKTLSVYDKNTGEVVLEKKFYKAEFGDVMRDPQYKPFIDRVAEAALMLSYGDDETQIEGETPTSDGHDEEQPE